MTEQKQAAKICSTCDGEIAAKNGPKELPVGSILRGRYICDTMYRLITVETPPEANAEYSMNNP